MESLLREREIPPRGIVQTEMDVLKGVLGSPGGQFKQEVANSEAAWEAF